MVLRDRGGVGETLAAGLEALGAEVLAALPAAGGSAIRGVVDLRPLDEPADTGRDAAAIRETANRLCTRASEIIRDRAGSECRVWWVTRGAQAAGDSPITASSQAAANPSAPGSFRNL